MKRYNTHADWNKVLDLPPGVERDHNLKVLGILVKSNLCWFTRRFLGRSFDPAYEFAHKEMVARSMFINYMDKLYETSLSKDS